MEVVEFLHTVIAFYKEFSQLNGQLCPEYRDFRFRQKIRQGPNGIRMTMGQENTRNAVLVFKQIIHVGDNDIHPKLLIFWILQTCIQDKNRIVHFGNVEIFPIFSNTAKSD